MMKLYGIAGSPNTWKTRAVAAHVGQPLTYVEIDVMSGGTRTPEFLALNPTARTPVLVDGDFTLWESTAIMQYLAATTGSALWPDNHRTRADIMRWQSWQLAHWGKEACEPQLWEMVVKQIFNLGPVDQAVVARAQEAFRREAAVLDAHLKGREWLVGGGPTLADFSVGSYLFLAKGNLMPIGGYANIAKWFGRLSELPEWSQTAPDFAAAA